MKAFKPESNCISEVCNSWVNKIGILVIYMYKMDVCIYDTNIGTLVYILSFHVFSCFFVFQNIVTIEGLIA